MILQDTYIVFELHEAAYAVRSSEVQHLEMLTHVTPVPNAAPTVDGVVFSRGNVVPAINLRARFGLPRQEATLRTRLIFLRVADRCVALIVDAAREFRKIPADSIQPVPSHLVGIAGDFVEGVATILGRSVLLLNVAAILTFEESTLPAGHAGQP